MKIRIKNEPMIKYLQFGERFFMLVKDFTGKWNHWTTKKQTTTQSMNWCKRCKYQKVEYWQKPCYCCFSSASNAVPSEFVVVTRTKAVFDQEYENYCKALEKGDYYPDPRD